MFSYEVELPLYRLILREEPDHIAIEEEIGNHDAPTNNPCNVHVKEQDGNTNKRK